MLMRRRNYHSYDCNAPSFTLCTNIERYFSEGLALKKFIQTNTAIVNYKPAPGWCSENFTNSRGGREASGRPPLTRLLEAVSRNEKKILRKLIKNRWETTSVIFFPRANIEVTRSHQRSNLAKYHISSELCHYL